MVKVIVRLIRSNGNILEEGQAVNTSSDQYIYTARNYRRSSKLTIEIIAYGLSDDETRIKQNLENC
ncbi:MAG: hypothetical protein PHW04_09675 [Candidatus Wallbacteria bacterium]|nr:hypothetical protein [Candidatus Wallbacteria bacterium]